MTRIIFMMLIAGTFSVIGCSSNNTNNNAADSTGMIMPDTATSALGADTTSAASDSLKDSLNR